MGLMLYWAEGDKSLERQSVKFCNSDPIMIQFMMKWFREHCHVPNDKFFIELNIHELLDKEQTKLEWSKITQVPLEKFRTFVKPSKYSFKRNEFYTGTCSIKIHSVDVF